MDSGRKDPPGKQEPAGPGAAAPKRSETRRWGAATGAYVVVVLALLVAVNLVGSQISTTFDLTTSRNLTLSTASKQIVGKLTQDVKVYAFELPGSSTGTKVEVLLNQYAADSHGHLTYQVVDPQADPTLATAYGVTTAGEVVVVAGKNTQTLQASDLVTYNNSGAAVFSGEGAITNAIIRAASPVTFTVDFAAGNGEPDITTGRFPGAVSALKDQGYNVGTLSLLSSKSIPSSVACLIIASPQTDFTSAEVTMLKNYETAGGHVMVLLDPLKTALPNLDALLSSWGVTPQNNLVVDTGLNNNVQGDATYLIPNYGSSPITAPLTQANLQSVIPYAQGFTLGKPSAYTVTPLLTTSGTAGSSSPSSWGIPASALTSSTGATFDPKVDTAGPLTVGVAVVANAPGSGSSSGAAGGSSTSATSATGSSSSTSSTGPAAAGIGVNQFRAVVVGDSLFISSGSASSSGVDPISTFPGNKDLFLNSVGWLTGRSQGIALRPSTSLTSQVTLTGGQSRLLSDTFLIGVPLVCFLLAFSTWWSRRKL